MIFFLYGLCQFSSAPETLQREFVCFAVSLCRLKTVRAPAEIGRNARGILYDAKRKKARHSLRCERVPIQQRPRNPAKAICLFCYVALQAKNRASAC